MNYSARPMVTDDLPAVVAIERDSFPLPWSAAYFCRELTANEVASYLVACWGEVVVGYLGLWLVVGEVHITTLAVHCDHRRRGLAEMLLLAAIDVALEHDAVFVTLEVRRSNQAARALYSKCGFEEVGIRRRYYTETGEDAIIMTTENITSALFREVVHRLKLARAEKTQCGCPTGT